MAKRTINLLIVKDLDPSWLKKLRIILPVTAAFVFILFLVSFIWSYLFINSHLVQYNITKKEVAQLEQHITDQKTTEGIYTLTHNSVSVLQQLSKLNKNYTKVFDTLLTVQTDGIIIVGSSTDSKGVVTFTATSTSSGALASLVENLRQKDEKEHLFSKIESQGVIRDKTGGYNMTVSLKANQSLLQ